MNFPEGQIRAKCPTIGCGANWELGPEGFWQVVHISEDQQIREAAKVMHEAIEFFKIAMEVAFNRVFNTLNVAANEINPKWFHYYQRSRKRRIRKKYEKLIRNYLADSLHPLRKAN
jgi:hypothetical protein